MHNQPETHATLATRSHQEWLAQDSARHPLLLSPSTPGFAFSAGHPRRKAAWRNTLGLVAVAVAIALLMAKNLDRNPSSHFRKASAIFEVSGPPKATP
jgi:hypothetical protein